jgi:hypothetical protein
MLGSPKKSRSLQILAGLVAMGLASFGGCNCDEELYVLPGILTGTLCSVDSGQPVGNVPLLVETADGKTVETTTREDGTWEVARLSPGLTVITADTTAIDGQPRTFEADVISGETVQVPDDQCRPPEPPPEPITPNGSVSGCVCNEATWNWVEGANVFIVTESGQTVVTGTDANGCFLLEGAPTGNHTVSVQKVDENFYQEFQVNIIEDQTVTIDSPESCEPPPEAPVGSISGRVCAPDGTTWLGEALVYVELPDGSRITATTDAEGNYTLNNVPEGTQTVHVVKGSFTDSFEVTVTAGETYVVPESECEIQPEVAVAVVSGRWDDVRSVLINVGIDPANITDYVGYGDFTGVWASQLLGDYTLLSQYDIVFINCGVEENLFRDTPQQVVIDNLKQFVQNGGSVYASDQAYDVVEVAFGNYIDFFGADGTSNAAEVGATVDSVTATVTDATLATQLGQSTLELHYPLPAWAVMTDVDSSVRVYVRADADYDTFLTSGTQNNVPHTVSFEYGQGKVIYTSFHQEPGINLTMERVLQLLMFEL